MKQTVNPSIVNVTTTNGTTMLHQGKVLNLVGFMGDITVIDSLFSGNQLAYIGCSVFTNIESKMSSNQNLQVKNIISVRNHSASIKLVNNTFETNSVVNGVVYLELVNTDSTYALVTNNTFDSNMAYVGTSALIVRSYTSK